VSPVFHIARNGSREALRRRVMYLILLFVVALVAATESAARFEAQVQVKMVKDFSYTIVSFFGLLVVLISTFDQIPSEVDSKTIYLPLARPISRQLFILGKYIGIVGVLGAFLVMMGLILAAAIGLGAGQGRLTMDAQLLQGLLLLFFKYMCWASLLLLFSVIMSRPLAVVFALFVYFFGHLSDFLDSAVASVGVAERFFDYVLRALSFALPKFSLMDPPGSMVYAQSYNWGSVAVLAAYALSFTAFYLLLAVWIFARKEL
jgi:Cu-processing system permease protein